MTCTRTRAAVAGGDRLVDLLVRGAVHRLALETVGVLAQAPPGGVAPAGAEGVEQRQEQRVARRLGDRAVELLVGFLVVGGIGRFPGLATSPCRRRMSDCEARRAARRAITGSTARRTSITSSGLVNSRMRSNGIADIAAATARSPSRGRSTVGAATGADLSCTKVPRPWWRVICPSCSRISARAAASGGRLPSRWPRCAPGECGRRRRARRSQSVAEAWSGSGLRAATSDSPLFASPRGTDWSHFVRPCREPKPRVLHKPRLLVPIWCEVRADRATHA